MFSDQARPCPICFELPPDSVSPDVWRARYTNEDNFSWANRSVCDAHGICNGCLAQHIAVQVRSEGKLSIRCPGEGCGYHLLYKDVERALQGTDGGVLQLLERMRSESCQGRLKEIVHASADDAARSWLVSECQPCPECFVVARRETGCNHVKCRCGCDFCISCGAPMRGGPDAVCLCPWLKFEARTGSVFFAAWLRTSWASPCEWLRLLESSCAAEEQVRFIGTLGFWLWIAGARLDPPAVWEMVVGAGSSEQDQPTLEPLRWIEDPEWRDDVDLYPGAITDLDMDSDEDIHAERTDLAAHLRKEIYSLSSHRALRRRARRHAPGAADDAGVVLGASLTPRRPCRPRREKARRWRGRALAEDAP